MNPSRKLGWLVKAIAFVVIAGLTFPLLCVLYVSIFPPMTPDGHPVMPTGQILCGILGAGTLGAVGAYLLGRLR